MRAAGKRAAPLRIALDIRTLGVGPSGVSTFLRNLIPEMLAQSAHEFVFLWDRARRPAALDRWPPGRWVSAPVPHAPKRIWEQVLLPLWLRRYGVDVFHWPSGAGGLVLRPLAGCRVVVTVHDLIPLIYPADYFRNTLHRVYFHVLLALSRHADAVLTISEASKRDLVSLGRFDPSKIVVIPEGVDREMPTHRPPEPIPAAGPGWEGGIADEPSDNLEESKMRTPEPAEDRPYFLAMGSGEPRKNVARIVQAFLQIQDRIPHRLLVVGAPWRGRGVRIPPEAPPDRIRALGSVSNSRLRELYRNATAFVYPSLQEGFGLPVLEAMASGAPVITSRAGSLPEVAGPAAVYVDAEDPSSIAGGMLEVIVKPDLREHLLAAGRARLQAFSWRTAARQTLEVYERVARRSFSRRARG